MSIALPALKARRQTIATLTILAVGTLFLIARSNLGSMDKYYSFSDNLTEDYPMQHYFNDRLSQGEIALWNPYQSGGNPVIGTLQHRLLYPPRFILAALFGVDRGQFLEIIFHFFLGLIGTYALLRSFRLSTLAALTATLPVLLSAEFLGVFDNLQGHVGAMMWIPVCMFATRKFTLKPTLPGAVFLAFSLSMLVYGGYAQYTFFGIHAALIVFLGTAIAARRKLRRTWRNFIAMLFLSVVIFMVLTGPQLISTSEFFAEGIRGHTGVSAEQFLPFPQQLWQLIPHTFVGQNFPIQAHLLNLLMVLGFAIGWIQLRRFRFQIVTMLVIVLMFGLLAMGNATPVAEWFYNNYPLGSVFRLPHRAQCLLLFPFAFAIGLLGQTLLRIQANTRLRAGLLICCVLLPALIIPTRRLNTQAFVHVTTYMNSFAEEVQRKIPGDSNGRFDTICGGMFIEPCQKAGMMARRNQLSDYDPSNSYRTYLHTTIISEKLRSAEAAEIWLGDTLLTLKTLKDEDAMRQLRAASVGWLLVDTMRWTELSVTEQQQILSTPGLSHVGTLGNREILLNIIGKEMIQLFSERLRGDLSLYQILKMSNPLPRAYLSNQIVWARDPLFAAALLAKSDPLQETVIEVPEGIVPDIRKDAADHRSAAKFLIDEPERVVLSTVSRGDTFLVLNDKYFPGWECELNGSPARIFPANVNFRAVALPPGNNTIEFLYRPRFLKLSIWLSLIGYLVLLVVSIVSVRGWLAKSR